MECSVTMKKPIIISITLAVIFLVTILLNTLLSVDFIGTTRKCKVEVTYSGMDIPPIIEEELQKEFDSNNDSNCDLGVMSMFVLPSFHESCSSILSEFSYLRNLISLGVGNLSDALFIAYRNFRI